VLQVLRKNTSFLGLKVKGKGFFAETLISKGMAVILDGEMPSSEEDSYSMIFTSLKHPVRRKILRILSNEA